MESYLTSATQVLDWLIANADRIGLAIAVIVAAYLRWRGVKEAAAKDTLIDAIEDTAGTIVRRVAIAGAPGIVNPEAAAEAVKKAIKKEVETRGNDLIDRAVAAMKGKKS